MRAGIQLAFFIAAPSLFSTAFAGIKSIFLAIAAGQPVEWNSFLTVTAVLLIFTCFFGRHFCGYACAFGSFGDAVYEGFSWIWMKCFHKKKKPALSEKMVHGLQKVKYIVLALILLSCLTGVYGKLTGTSPWDVFSMLTAGRLPNSKYLVGIVLLVLIIVGMCTQERFFCQFLCPMGAVFALMPILPGALFRRTVRNVRRNVVSVKKDVRLIWISTATQADPANVFAATHVPQHAREKIFTLEQLRKNDL